MSLSQAKHAFRLFRNVNAPKSVVKYNVRAYLKAMETLGDKWLLATKIQRKVS